MSRLVRRQKGSQVRPRHRGLNWKFWRKLIWKLFASTGDRKVDGRLIRPTFGLIKDSSTHFAGNISTKSFLMSARDNWIELLHRNLLRAVTNEMLSAIVRESIVDRSRMSWNWVLWEMKFDEQVFNYLRTKSLLAGSSHALRDPNAKLFVLALLWGETQHRASLWMDKKLFLEKFFHTPSAINKWFTIPCARIKNFVAIDAGAACSSKTLNDCYYVINLWVVIIVQRFSRVRRIDCRREERRITSRRQFSRRQSNKPDLCIALCRAALELHKKLAFRDDRTVPRDPFERTVTN